MRRLDVLGAAVGAVAMLATACGGGTSSSPGPTSTTPTSASAPAPAPANNGGQVTAAPPGATTTVMVKMTDFHLALSTQTFAPGTYSFVAANDGHTVHSLQIDGPGVADQRIPGVVAVGQSSTLTVTLRGGSYEIYCPVDGHKAMGMDTHITVGGSPATTTPAAPTSTSESGGGY